MAKHNQPSDGWGIILLSDSSDEAKPGEDVCSPEEGYQCAHREEGTERDGVLAPFYFEQEQHRRHQPPCDDAEEKCQQHQRKACSQPHESCQLDITPAHPSGDDGGYE